MKRERKLCLAANWKMNQSLRNLESYHETLKKMCKPSLEKITDSLDVVLGVPSLFLTEAERVFASANIKVSAQNMHWEDSGAFTGEISAGMLLEGRIKMAIIGHSERRTLFGETNKDIALKFEKSLSEGLTPILCVGENLEERKEEKTFSVLEEQLEGALSCSLAKTSSFMIAYEPVWAIGTGLTASPEQAHEAHSFIRNFLKKKLGEKIASETRILYGGSMKPEVTAELLQSPEIDGGLVGGASLNPETFASMLNIAYEISL